MEFLTGSGRPLIRGKKVGGGGGSRLIFTSRALIQGVNSTREIMDFKRATETKALPLIVWSQPNILSGLTGKEGTTDQGQSFPRGVGLGTSVKYPPGGGDRL